MCISIMKNNSVNILTPNIPYFRVVKCTTAPNYTGFHAVFKNGQYIEKKFASNEEMNNFLRDEFGFHSTELKD